MNRTSWRCAALATACVVALSGCPVPVPPLGDPLSRTNLTDRVPEFIVQGRTTRHDVLLALGSPDSHAPDGTWYGYRSERHTGGLVFVIPAGGSAVGAGVFGYEERLLIVRFDADGIVVDASMKSRLCQRGVIGAGSSGGESPPCLTMPDPASVGSAAGADMGTAIAVYENVVWCAGRVNPLSAGAVGTSRAGQIVVTERGVLAVDAGKFRGTLTQPGSADAQPAMHWMPYEQVDGASMKQHPTGPAAELSMRDGRAYSMVILPSAAPGLIFRLDQGSMRDLVARIDRALQDHGRPR